MRWFLPCSALVAVVCALPSRSLPSTAVRASTAIPLDIEGLLAEADLVIEARVTALHQERRDNGRVETEYVLRVTRTYWGGERHERLLRLPGGILPDGSGMLIPGVPSFLLGEELLLALSPADLDGLRMPIGLDQGCYRLRTEPNGERIAWHGPASSATIDPDTGLLRSGAGAFGLPYGELAARLTAAAEARRAGLLAPQGAGR